ncbi:MAG: hypothetical protein PVG79_09290 [Gemmatimonadales bacterium]|jgi:hypothetical protein
MYGSTRRQLLARRILALVAATALWSACEQPAANLLDQLVISEVDTLVSLESGLLASPADLAVDNAGNAYVLDWQLPAVVVLPVTGDDPVSFGNEGAGPAEFSRPSVLAAGGDSIRVLDSGNGRVQVLTTDGSYIRSYPMPADYIGGADLHPNGRLAVPTQGFRHDALALTFQPDGQPGRTFGTLLVPRHEFWDMTAIRDQIIDGEVPRELRNWTLPIIDADASLWLILNAEAVVQRYDARGNILWSLHLVAPEMTLIKERFFARNRELQAPGFVPLIYVADAARVDDEIWLLLNLPDEHPSVVLAVGHDGTLRRRLDFPNVYGAADLAVDHRRGRIYLAVPADASLLAALLPADY